MLITFEGIDGSGKSTQIEKLKSFLHEEGYKTATFREPGGTKASEKIRRFLLDSSLELDSVTELFLFSAARSQLIRQKILPLINDNYIVILDRFYDSTTAYQGYGRGDLSIKDIRQINQIASNYVAPDITFYLKISLQQSRKRTGESRDRIEKSDDEFYRRVIQGFDQLAQDNDRIITVDALRKKETVARQIIQSVQPLLPPG